MDSKKILPVKSDIVFRMFFADEKNTELLIGFLKSVLQLADDEYDEIEIADPYLLPDYIGEKLAIIDVKLHTKSRKVIHIEIQLKVTPEIRERIVYYDAKLITEQLGVSGKYSEIKKVISILITEKPLFSASERYHHRFVFYDAEAQVVFTEMIEIHTIELLKLPEITDGTELYDWAKFIAAESEEELDMVAERNPQIKKAVLKLRELSADEKARDLYDRREKALRDIESNERHARAAGRAEGKAEERELWQNVVADKDAKLADRDAKLANQDMEISRLRALLDAKKNN
jgi:predicted transposase/invertase (TIGR01784 family)